MVRWEYLVRVFSLDKDDEVVINYVSREYPGTSWKDIGRYDPMTLEAWLNQCGSEGWELVRIEPAQTQGKQGDIGRTYPPSTYSWARYYMCVFKRPSGS